MCLYILEGQILSMHTVVQIFMYVCTPQIYVCVYVCIPTIYVCVYVCISEIYVFVYVCMSDFCIFMYVATFMYIILSYVYRVSNFMFLRPSFFIIIPFVKVVDFTAGDVLRGHGHFWWIYPLGARFRYGASLLDFHHAFGLIHKNIRFC